MLLCAPLALGPFVVNADGRLSPSTPDHFPSFRVTWRGHVVQARLTAASPGGGVLDLRTVLGRVRSTGRPDAPQSLPRRDMFAAVRALPATLPPGWKLDLLPDHRLLARSESDLALPTGAEDLVSEIALFVFRLTPYLELLAEEAGIEPAGGAALGIENTCPG